MRNARDWTSAALLASLLGLPEAAAAQGLIVRPMVCDDVFTRIAARIGAGSDGPKLVARFAAVLARLATTEGRELDNGRRLQFVEATPKCMLVARDSAANLDVISAAVERLIAERPDRPTRLRIQCSVLCVPSEVAALYDVGVDKVLPRKPEEVSKFLRAVAEADGGSLRNLPEVTAEPLVPFAIARPKPAAEADDREPRVRGEAFAIDGDSYVLGVQLVHGTLGDSLVDPPKAATIDRAVRLRVGGCALIAGRPDEHGSLPVLWLQLVAIE